MKPQEKILNSGFLGYIGRLSEPLNQKFVKKRTKIFGTVGENRVSHSAVVEFKT